jgi:uncharacterized protein
VKKPQPAETAPQPVLEYPLDYGFTIFGLASEDFPEHARRIVARFVPGLAADAVSVRSSAGGKYHAVSVAVRLASEEQRTAVVQALQDDERVLFVL